MFLSLCGRFTNRCTRPKVPLLTLPHGGALSVPRFNNRTAKVHIYMEYVVSVAVFAV